MLLSKRTSRTSRLRINEIISYVDINYSQLKARGESMSDAVEHILMTFAKAIDDDNFKKYFKQKQDDYWDETDEMKAITVEALIAKAKTKFDLLKAQKTWGTLSQEIQDILHSRLKLQLCPPIILNLPSNSKASRLLQNRTQRTMVLPNRREIQKQEGSRRTRKILPTRGNRRLMRHG